MKIVNDAPNLIFLFLSVIIIETPEKGTTIETPGFQENFVITCETRNLIWSLLLSFSFTIIESLEHKHANTIDGLTPLGENDDQNEC